MSDNIPRTRPAMIIRQSSMNWAVFKVGLYARGFYVVLVHLLHVPLIGTGLSYDEAVADALVQTSIR